MKRKILSVFAIPFGVVGLVNIDYTKIFLLFNNKLGNRVLINNAEFELIMFLALIYLLALSFITFPKSK